MQAGEAPGTVTPLVGRGVHDVYVYLNLSTGERIVTLPTGERGVEPAGGNDEVAVWLSLTSTACETPGSTSGVFYSFEEDGPPSVLDWGDVSADTVVDCVHINWATDYRDTDTDSDSIGDGVVGLAGRWVLYDADNGRASDAVAREPLLSILFTDLPGDFFDDGLLTRYSFDIDLTSSLSADLSFEIGDSDGDLQGAAFGNTDLDTNSDGIGDGVSIAQLYPDLDGDGLFDWSYETTFYRPGSMDFDSDGEVDGVPDPDAIIAVDLASPEGMAVDQGGGDWEWVIDAATPGAGTGSEDLISVGGGLYNFGGFSCGADAGSFRPRADIAIGLYAREVSEPCPIDFDHNGILNFFDIWEFMRCFGQQQSFCDFNHDGRFDFFDVSILLQMYQQGCP